MRRRTSRCTSNATSRAAGESRVYDTDVLVIGAGIAGMTAAIEASENGARVIVLDKGPFGRSGSSGLNFGYWFLSELQNKPWPDDPDHLFSWLIRYSEGIGNQEFLRSLADGMFAEKRALWAENSGSICQRTGPDKIDFQPGTSGVLWTLYPWATGQELLRRGIPVFERTMVTRLLTRDGQGCGATAFDIRTGEFIVFRAKSVIVATGSFGWLYGWYGVGPLSAVQPECTGDCHALLYYAGVELTNMEFGEGQMRSVSPATLAGSFGGIQASLSSPDIVDGLHNKDGEYFLKHRDFASITLSYGEFSRIIADQLQQGKGGPEGGVFYDVRAGWDKNGYRVMTLRAKEYLGWDAREESVEVLPALYDWGVGCLVQANVGPQDETAIPGIYALAMGATSFCGNAWGLRTGRAAAERAATAAKLELDDNQVIAERRRLHSLLEKHPRDALRPHVVRHRVQKLATQYMGLARSAEGLSACVAELERIRREDYPRMWVASKTRTWNREFVEALETEFMIDVQEMAARSALMRTESRFTHYRIDYPNNDNHNWLANTYVKHVDGEMLLERRPIICTEIPIHEVRKMLQ